MRRLALVPILLAAVALPQAANALGLGEIELHSALNQRLDAEIPLRGVEGELGDDILVTLASEQAFRDVGLDRPFALTRLAFEVKQHDDGAYYIQVNSTEPIVEPFLSFLVEVDWPGGNLLREYTVLLDPPVFTTDTGETGGAAPKAEREAEAAAADRDRRSEKPVFLDAEERDEAAERERRRRAEREAAERQAREARTGQREYGPVSRGETLWSIAGRLKRGDMTVQQMMLALLRYNREAFVDDNINRLKEGYVLRVPPADEVASISAQRALARVNEQNAAWQRWRRQTGTGTTVAASQQAAGPGADEGATEGAAADAELDIVGAGEGGASSDESASATTAGERSTQDELQLTREQLESVRMEKQELESRVNELEKTVKKMEQLLMVRNDKLEQLQSQLEQVREQQGKGETGDKAKDEDEAATEVAAAGTGGDGAGTAADGGTGGAGDTPGGGDAGERLAAAEGTGTAAVAADAGGAAGTSTAPADAAADSTPGDKAAEGVAGTPQTSPTPAPTWLDRVNNVLAPVSGLFRGGVGGTLLGPIGLGAAAIVVLLAALLVMRRRRAATEAEGAEAVEAAPLPEDTLEEAAAATPEPEDTAAHSAEGGTGEAAGAGAGTAEDAESALMAEEFDVGTLEEEGPVARTALTGLGEQEEVEKDDTVAEADVYLAYGLHQQAEDLLRLALKESPENPQYHEKLLETLYGAGKKGEFVDEAQSFRGLVASPEDQLWQRVVAMGKDIAPEHELFAKTETQYTAADVQPTRPAGADIELDEGAASSDADFSFDEASAPGPGDTEEDEFSSTMMLDAGDSGLAEGDSGLVEPSQPPAPEATGQAGSGAGESDVELDLGDFGELAGEPEAGETEWAASGGDELEFDVGDVDTGAEPGGGQVEAEGAPREAATSADESLDVGLDLTGAEGEEPTVEGAGDFGLDLDTGAPEAEAAAPGAEPGISGREPASERPAPETRERGPLEGEAGSATAAESGEDAGGPEEGTFDLSDLETGGEADTDFDWGEFETLKAEPEAEGVATEGRAVEDTAAAAEGGAAGEAEEDEYDTMLDLARAYIDMGDAESATDALQEVAQSGNERQRSEAQSLLETVG